MFCACGRALGVKVRSVLATTWKDKTISSFYRCHLRSLRTGEPGTEIEREEIQGKPSAWAWGAVCPRLSNHVFLSTNLVQTV